MQHSITYEQPLSERIRAFLRLEYLFRQAGHFLRGTSPFNSQAVLLSIVEIQNLLARNDVKTEVLKELERHTANLARLEQTPGVDGARLSQILGELDGLTDRLHADNQQLGAELKQNEFLNSLRQRAAIPGGICDFDLPGYHHWLRRPPEQRTEDLAAWLGTFEVLEQAIVIILDLIRESAVPRRTVAGQGFYQQSLEGNSTCQLVRVGLAADAEYFPEVSGGKHRITIRFMQQPNLAERPTPVQEDVEFLLCCCAI